MKKKNANISGSDQNHAIAQKHFGKLELADIGNFGCRNRRNQK